VDDEEEDDEDDVDFDDGRSEADVEATEPTISTNTDTVLGRN
jgi:hypothetical protein